MAQDPESLKIPCSDYFDTHTEKYGIELFTSDMEIVEVPGFKFTVNVNNSVKPMFNNGVICDNVSMDNFIYFFDNAMDEILFEEK